MMFPYPSAEGLHVGNMYAFTGSDMYGRYKQMQGYDVFQPIGLDGFGIHSENYAMKKGRHPFEHAKVTEENFYKQLQKIGAMFDWSRTVETYKEEYYRWTQWVFIKLYEKGLVYRSKAAVNWCPSCKTVLADEQVIDGKCERCASEIVKKQLTQWFFRITEYAEKLDEHIDQLQWSEKVKVAQKNWIGRKEGINITYSVVNEAEESVGEVVCFTTRPDTNFGATFVVIAPEHNFVTQLMQLLDKKELDKITSYVESSKKTSDIERVANGRKKTGVFTGLYCMNNLTNTKMPMYISDFVLMNVGTGAVVGVPGHDLRDFEFAKTFSIPILRVVIPSSGENGLIERPEDVYEGEGTLVNSGFLNGMTVKNAKEEMMKYLEKKGWGKRVTTYHLRDWLISRQRFWGPPIPMIYCESCAKNGKSWFTQHVQKQKLESSSEESLGWYPVPEKDLPVQLPYIEDFSPGDDGVAPLKKHKEFYETICPECGESAVRETDVSDTFLDSSWYFLRYPSVGLSVVGDSRLDRDNQLSEKPKTSKPTVINQQPTFENRQLLPWDPVITNKWLPVHMYSGGAEHSVLHLMYSRFVTMALHDLGYIDFDEPFLNFFAHGLVIKDGAKMSKSKGNVVNPDEYIESYGSDALRCYLMFMGPYSDGGDFRDSAMEGMYKWIGRVWRLVNQVIEQKETKKVTDEKVSKALHRLIKKVGDDIERRHYNTAIASMMEFTNLVSEKDITISIDDIRCFMKLLAPFAPHITEELYQKSIGNELLTLPSESIHHQKWPTYEESMLVDTTVEMVIQVNGKLRGRLTLSSEQSLDQEYSVERAKELESVSKYIEKGIKKTIFVPKKLLNFVV